LRSQMEHESSRRCDDVAMLRGLVVAEVQRLEALVSDLSQKCLDESHGSKSDGAAQGCETEPMQRLCLIEALVNELRDGLNKEQASREAEAAEVRNCLGAEKSARSADILSVSQRVDYLENLVTDEIAKSLAAGKESSEEARHLWNTIDGHMNQLSSQIDDMHSDTKERVTVMVPNPDAGGGPPGGDANKLDPRLASPLAGRMKVQPARPCRWPSPCVNKPVSPVALQPSNRGGGSDRRAKTGEPIMSSPLPPDPLSCMVAPCQQQHPPIRSAQRPSQVLVRQGSLSPSSVLTHAVVQTTAAVRVLSPPRSVPYPTMKMDLCSQ